jgi:hypothetical protein
MPPLQKLVVCAEDDRVLFTGVSQRTSVVVPRSANDNMTLEEEIPPSGVFAIDSARRAELEAAAMDDSDSDADEDDGPTLWLPLFGALKIED